MYIDRQTDTQSLLVKITANLSPLESQAIDCTQPPTLKNMNHVNYKLPLHHAILILEGTTFVPKLVKTSQETTAKTFHNYISYIRVFPKTTIYHPSSDITNNS